MGCSGVMVVGGSYVKVFRSQSLVGFLVLFSLESCLVATRLTSMDPMGLPITDLLIMDLLIMDLLLMVLPLGGHLIMDHLIMDLLLMDLLITDHDGAVFDSA